MTDKQAGFIDSLCNKNGYILVVQKESVNNAAASKIISFFLNQDVNYDEVSTFIKKRGPAIPELHGDFLYDDSGRGRVAK